MSLVENIFDDYFLYEVPHINKRYVEYFFIKIQDIQVFYNSDHI